MTAKSWKTSLFGVIGAAAVAIVESPQLVDYDRTVLLVAKIALALSVGGIGITARDERVSDEQAQAGVKPKPDPQEVIVVKQEEIIKLPEGP